MLRLAPAQHTELFEGIDPAPPQPAEALTRSVREAFGRFVEALRTHQHQGSRSWHGDTLQANYDRLLPLARLTSGPTGTSFMMEVVQVNFAHNFFRATEAERETYFARFYALQPDTNYLSDRHRAHGMLFTLLRAVYTQPHDVNPDGDPDEPCPEPPPDGKCLNRHHFYSYHLFFRATAVYGNRRREAQRPRALAFAMALHRRLGATAEARHLGSDLIGHIARLVMQD